MQFPHTFQYLDVGNSHGRVALLPSVPLTLKCLKPKGYPKHPQTLGAHIRKRRHELGLNQRDAAKQLRVNPFTILNWEKARRAPRAVDGGRLIVFLGYDPFPQPITVPERLLHERRKRGWSTTQAARHVGVHRTTWQDWEHGMLILQRKHRTEVARFLGVDPDGLAHEMRAR